VDSSKGILVHQGTKTELSRGYSSVSPCYMGAQHFILTRFNLLLWNKDKERQPVRTAAWLEHRFALFEHYCLPSIKNQTCQDFEWIVLFDSTTPERFKEKIKEFQVLCPQLLPVFVEPKNGRYFAEIFRKEVVSRLYANRVITTYLDNDDALHVRFVEDIRQRVQELKDGTFIYYTLGYQFYTDYNYLLQVHYPRNHFASVVERGALETVKTIYGYGSHYYICKQKDARIKKIENCPMWCEVIHERNMGNDAYFLNAKMVKDEDLLQVGFGVYEKVKYGVGIYLFRFLPRYVETFFRRCGYKLFGRHW